MADKEIHELFPALNSCQGRDFEEPRLSHGRLTWANMGRDTLGLGVPRESAGLLEKAGYKV